MFEKGLRLFKLRYQRGQLKHLEEMQTRSTQQFWSQINKLGPKQHKKIAMEVREEQGGLNTDITQVLKEWEKGFASLFSGNENVAHGKYNPLIYVTCI